MRLPSGVVLAGQGLGTILILEPKLKGPAIVNATDDLHDITMRDMVIEGALTSRPGSDPNHDRRVRSYQNALSRAGIVLNGQQEGQMRHLRLEHLTVRNCTQSGVAIKGAALVEVVACDFSDNGAGVAPGPRLLHNLLLSHVTGGRIQDSRLDNSPWGSGLDLTQCREVIITNNEAARNALHGIRVADSQEVRLRGNLAEGNDGDGIFCAAQMDGCRNVEVAENLSRNNGGSGITTNGAAESTVHGNTVLENGRHQ